MKGFLVTPVSFKIKDIWYVIKVTAYVKNWAKIALLVKQLATGWTVRGSNPSSGRDFLHPSRLAMGPTQPPVWWVPDFSRGVKRPVRGIDHPCPSSSAEVKERIELYLYSRSGPSWPVLGGVGGEYVKNKICNPVNLFPSSLLQILSTTTQWVSQKNKLQQYWV